MRKRFNEREKAGSLQPVSTMDRTHFQALKFAM